MLISIGLQNFSARTLRPLPVVSLAMFSRLDPCPIDEALRALSLAVDDKSLRGQKDSAEDVKMIDYC